MLAAHVMNAAVDRAGIDPARIDKYFGAWAAKGARKGAMPDAWRRSPPVLPQSVPAFMLSSIICDELDVALAGGMDSISLTVTKDAPRYVDTSVADEEPAVYIPMIETA